MNTSKIKQFGQILISTGLAFLVVNFCVCLSILAYQTCNNVVGNPPNFLFVGVAVSAWFLLIGAAMDFIASKFIK